MRAIKKYTHFSSAYSRVYAKKASIWTKFRYTFLNIENFRMIKSDKRTPERGGNGEHHRIKAPFGKLFIYAKWVYSHVNNLK